MISTFGKSVKKPDTEIKAAVTTMLAAQKMVGRLRRKKEGEAAAQADAS